MARIVLTRPTEHIAAWSNALSSAGHEVVSLPLIEIAPLDTPEDRQILCDAWKHLPQYSAVMFVSKPAVGTFFEPKWHLDITESTQSAPIFAANSCARLRFWATGPGTAAALETLGCPPARIDCPDADAEQFDSAALWRKVLTQVIPGVRVMIVRGRDAGSRLPPRDWLAHQIQAQGGVVHFVETYERRAPNWSVSQLKQCQSWLDESSVWLLSSSKGLSHLPPQLDTSKARCLCTHERIAGAARERGFAVVWTSRPSLPDVLASIKSMDE